MFGEIIENSSFNTVRLYSHIFVHPNLIVIYCHGIGAFICTVFNEYDSVQKELTLVFR